MRRSKSYCVAYGVAVSGPLAGIENAYRVDGRRACLLRGVHALSEANSQQSQQPLRISTSSLLGLLRMLLYDVLYPRSLKIRLAVPRRRRYTGVLARDSHGLTNKHNIITGHNNDKRVYKHDEVALQVAG